MTPDVMYVLVLDKTALFTSEYMERLSAAMAGYSPLQQAQMHIDVAQVLE